MRLKSRNDFMFDVHKFIFFLEHELPATDTGDRTVESS
jgi:hypothetical protein